MSEKVNIKVMNDSLYEMEKKTRKTERTLTKGIKEKYRNEMAQQEERMNQRRKRQVSQEIRNNESEMICQQLSLFEGTPLLASEQQQIEKKTKEPKGLPSLYRCAEQLKEKVELISYQDSLYYYNGKCFDMLNDVGTAKLYRKEVDNSLNGEKSMNTIMQLHKFLTTDSDICMKELHNNMRIAVLNNGIFDVERQRLYAHNPEKITFSYIDAEYVQNPRCKHFDQFLYEAVGRDEVLLERLWMCLGYLLMHTMEGKCFFVMGQASDSGKSLFGKFIQSLFPTRYVSNIALNDFNKEFSLAPLVGSAINISLDLPDSKLNANAVSRLKMLTGGDVININQKYMPEFRYENRAKFLFASNFPISITENDNAFWKRLVYLPFEHSVPKRKQNPELIKKFEKEKNAIVSKALWYAKELIELNFRFPTTSAIECKMQEWQGVDNSSMESFIQECCYLDSECKGELVENLYFAYQTYCQKISCDARKRSAFKRFLDNQLGLEHFKMRGKGENPQSAFRGIALRGGVEYGE